MTRLNIECASRVHVVEPHWNPSVEKQAIGRAIRLGQTKDVVVVRYIIAGTIEEVSPWRFLGMLLDDLLIPSWYVVQYVRRRQEQKLELATLGWDSREEEHRQKLADLEVCVFLYLYF